MLIWLPFCLFFSSCADERIEVLWVPQTIEMHRGYSMQLTDPFSTKNLNWRSSNPTVVTVSSTGLATAVGPGKATIYSSDNEKDVVCHLEIYPRRNILFYISADKNGLDNGNGGNEPKQKIDEIRKGWEPDKGEMLIYTDQTDQGANLFRISDTKGDNGLYLLDTIYTYGSENSADPEVLSRVIQTVVQEHPADSYGMIFFSHASGWLPKGMLANPRSSEANQTEELNPESIDLRSLIIDNGQEMAYHDFAAAIPDHQFDFIIFEACLMADVMSMYELRSKADYVLAASPEIVSPCYTYTYDKEAMRLFDTKEDAKTVVSGFAQSYYDYILQVFSEDNERCSVAMSLMKMDEMEALASATKTALQGVDFDESNLDVTSIQRFDRPNAKGMGGKPYPRYFDFEQTVEALAPASELAAFRAQMEKTVVWKVETKRFLLGNKSNGEPYFEDYDGFFIERHSGLTTYIKQGVYPEMNSAFEESSWYETVFLN